MKDFYGDDVRWFVGLVVNHTPPPGFEGRVKVRIRGIHTNNTVDIPESDLPWAQVILPTTEHGVSGFGKTPAISTGATVFGFFADGKDSQVPIVLGSFVKTEFETPVQQKLRSQLDRFPIVLTKEILTQDMIKSTRGSQKMIVHWTETYSNKDIGAAEIEKMHLEAGYDSIKYHYIILRDGRLQKGLDVNKEGMDGDHLSIAFVGGLNCPSGTQNPLLYRSIQGLTRAQFNKFERVCESYFEANLSGTIEGHSDIDPGFDVKQYVYAIFRR